MPLPGNFLITGTRRSQAFAKPVRFNARANCRAVAERERRKINRRIVGLSVSFSGKEGRTGSENSSARIDEFSAPHPHTPNQDNFSQRTRAILGFPTWFDAILSLRECPE